MTSTDQLGDEHQPQPTPSWKNFLRPPLIALVVWSLLAVSLSVLGYFSDQGALQQAVLLRRMADLFIPSLLFFAGPMLLFLVTFGLVRGQCNKATALGLKTGCARLPRLQSSGPASPAGLLSTTKIPGMRSPWGYPALLGGISSAQPWLRRVRLRWTGTRSGARSQGSERACLQ